MPTSEIEIKKFTQLLRSDSGAFWTRLRELLSQRGLDSQDVILADSFEDDRDFEFGIIVTRAGSVVQYGFSYLNKDISEGTFSEWKDITQNFKSTPYSQQASLAFKMWGLLSGRT